MDLYIKKGAGFNKTFIISCVNCCLNPNMLDARLELATPRS